MALSLASVGGKITAALFNALTNAVNANGMTLLVPTSVSGTGVTVTSAGRVLASAASSCQVNGVFSTIYEAYLVLINVPSMSASGTLALNLSANGTNDTSANYDTQSVYASGSSTAAAASLTGQTSLLLTPVGSALHRIRLEAFYPGTAQRTHFVEAQSSWSGSGSIEAGTVGGGHAVAAAYDGFTLTPSTGTMTGYVHVYGYNFG